MRARWLLLAVGALEVLSGCGKVANVLNPPPSQDGDRDGAATAADGSPRGKPRPGLTGPYEADGATEPDGASPGSAGTGSGTPAPFPSPTALPERRSARAAPTGAAARSPKPTAVQC